MAITRQQAVKVEGILQRFLEAQATAVASRKRRRLERRLEKTLQAMFRRQGKGVVAALRGVGRLLDQNAAADVVAKESLTVKDWAYLLGIAFGHTAPELLAEFDAATADALLAGAVAVIDGVGEIGLSFGLENPAAVAWAENRAARQIAGINATTEAGLRLLITQAVSEGHSWQWLKGKIEERFEGFATSRSKRIAIYEIGDAYEAGSRIAAEELKAAGLVMEKAWLSVGDDRVRPSHRKNQAEGWIDLDASFSSGDDRPPTDPGCRCTAMYQRKKNAKRN